MHLTNRSKKGRYGRLHLRQFQAKHFIRSLYYILTEQKMSLLIHVGIVLVSLWVASRFNFNSAFTYVIAFLYLYLIDLHCTRRIRMRIRHEEMKHANQKRVLSDSETVRWLNHSMEKIWPICLEKLASQEILMPIIPWFLEKYKPWTAKKATIQQLYLGRNPPVFTEMRALSHSSEDDHLVLDLGLSFLSAEDMSAVLSVQMRKRLGFGMRANLHVTGMHVEGKVRVGVRFLKERPFVKRIRLCFEEVPYFQMTVKPIFSHGLDVAELPGIAGWLDKILTYAFEQSLVEPNMLVIDVEQLLGFSQSSESDPKSLGKWFHIDGKLPVAYVKLEILEGADMKPSDPNGLADPFVKGCLGAYQFKTKIQKKTLAPKWQEEFKIPISSWDSPNQLVLNVRDKDTFRDDELGDCKINVSDLRGGQRHDKWISLQNVKTGRLHVALTVVDLDTGSKKREVEQVIDDQSSIQHEDVNGSTSYSSHSQWKANAPVADEMEVISPPDCNDSPMWIHRPGSDVSKTWSPRKNKSGKNNIIKSEEGHSFQDRPMSIESQTSLNEREESSDEEEEENDNTSKGHKMKKFRKKLQRLRSMFQKDKGNDKLSEPSNDRQREPSEKLVVSSNKGSGIRLVFDDVPENVTGQFVDMNRDTKNLHANAKDNFEDQKTDVEGPVKGHVKDRAKNILKQSIKSAHVVTNVLSKMNHEKDNNEGANGRSSFKESPSKDHNSDKSSLCDGDSAECEQECKLPLSQVSQNDMKLERDDTSSTSSNRSQNNMSLEEDNNNSTASSIKSQSLKMT